MCVRAVFTTTYLDFKHLFFIIQKQLVPSLLHMFRGTLKAFKHIFFFWKVKASVVETPADFYMKHISKHRAISISEFTTSYICDLPTHELAKAHTLLRPLVDIRF